MMRSLDGVMNKWRELKGAGPLLYIEEAQLGSYKSYDPLVSVRTEARQPALHPDWRRVLKFTAKNVSAFMHNF